MMPSNRAPVARLVGPSTATVGQPVTIDGSTSSDDVKIQKWSLAWGDGTVLAPKSAGHPGKASHVYAEPGTYDIVLTVTDQKKETSSATLVLTVEAVDQPPPPVDYTAPVVLLTFDQVTGEGEVSATDVDAALIAEVSLASPIASDDDEPLLTLILTVGPVPLAFTVPVATLAPGRHTLVARVRDSAGNEGSAQREFEIAQSPDPLPLPDTSKPSVQVAFNPTTGKGTVAATDADPTLRCEVSLLGSVIAQGPAPLAFTVDVAALPPGVHTGDARVWDTANNMGLGKFTITSSAPVPPPPEDDKIAHPYFYALATRPDVFAVYPLRSRANLEQFKRPNLGTGDVDYLYPNDSDPRQQDAMRIRIRQGNASPTEGVRLPLGPSFDQNILIVHEFWYGAEFDFGVSKILGHKVVPLFLFAGGGDTGFGGGQMQFNVAKQAVENLPPGGPYVAVTYAHINGRDMAKNPNWWQEGMPGFPPGELPYGESNTRRYSEAIQPFDTSVEPKGQELGVVADRWHRRWDFFERVPSEDYTPGQWWLDRGFTIMHAYKWSVWMADTEREPMRQVNEGIIGLPQHPTALGKNWLEAQYKWGAGGANTEALTVQRGDLVAYSRNWVVLHGTSKADVLTLLKKPVQ